MQIEAFDPLFALNGLRNLRSHPQGSNPEEKMRRALKAFGLSMADMKKGWGLGLDHVYDVLKDSFLQVSDLLHSVDT